MNIFDNFPHSNTHQINLDWILQEVKKAVETSTSAHKTATEVEAYVRNYFANLSLVGEAETILRKMENDGTLSRLISIYLDPEIERQNEVINRFKAEVSGAYNVLNARMDTFTALPDGSTTGDAELADARIDKNGKTHANVGTHIRSVTTQLSEQIDDLEAMTVEITVEEQITDISYSPLTTGTFVDQYGNKSTSPSYNCFENVVVKEGDILASSYKFRFVTAFVDGVVNSQLGGQELVQYVVPEGVTSVSLTLYSNEEQTLCKTEHVIRKVNIHDEAIALLEQKAEIFNNELFIDSTINLADAKKFINGIIDGSGTIGESTAYFTTDFVYVPSGETIYFTSSRRLIAYSIDKQTVVNYVDSESNTYTAHEDCYVRISGYNASRSVYQCNYGVKIYPFSEYTFGLSNVRKNVYIYAEEGMYSFYEKMKDAYKNGNIDVHIMRGDYVFTNEFVDTVRAEGLRGVPIGGNCRYYFDTAARLYCEYTGNNATDVVHYFSPLDSQSVANSYELYNLNLIAKNCCYAIHDECSGLPHSVKHVYKDCYITLDNSALGTNGNYISKAIGGGLGVNEEVIIENCVFHSTNPAYSIKEDVSYHSANNQSYTDAKLIVTGCWFENNFRADFNYGENVTIPRIIYSNNCSGREASLSGAEIYEWNNVVRPN